MIKPPPPDSFDVIDFDFTPQPGDKVTTDPIVVTVTLRSGTVDSFLGTLLALPGSGVVSGPIDSGPGTGGVFTISLAAGNVPAFEPPANNRAALVVPIVGGSAAAPGVTHDFKAFHDGSGSSSGSGSGFDYLAAARRNYSQTDQPVPVALRLQLDTPVAADTGANCNQLNRPTPLVHSLDPRFVCCWFSEPINFGAGSADAGFWMLQKSDATTWILLLRRGQVCVVSYRAQTPPAKDCSFPITLERADPGGSEFQSWPQTVTISSAP